MGNLSGKMDVGIIMHSDKTKLNSCFWSIIKTVVLVGLILAGVSYYFSWVNRFPELQNPKEVTFKWELKNQNYEIKKTLYESVDQYYAKKEKGISTGREESSIKRYLAAPSQDQTISDLTAQLVSLGQSRGLSKDEIVDLTLAFVQAIPYDSARAQTDLTHPRYPYEVLYENLGICSDKSLLADALMQKLGYGTAVFLFTSEEHMAIGVECPKTYSSYDSGYCFAETTATGNKIGLIPELQDNLQAKALAALPTYSENSISSSGKKLSNPLILNETTGLEYSGIINTLKLASEITSLKSDLNSESSQITSDEAKLKSMAAEMEANKSSGNIEAYNLQVPVYNSLLDNIKSEIAAYNSKVATYNNLIKEY
jgi:hypothetical protein